MSKMTYLWCRLHYVGVDQLPAALLPPTLSFRIHWWFWHGVITHSLEGLIQPANYYKHFKSRCLVQHKSALAALIQAVWDYLTCCSTRWGSFPRQSLVYQRSPMWSSCPCERHGEVLWAPPPFSSVCLAHWVTTTDWIQWQSNQTHHPEPAFSWHWSWRGQ